ncbi:MAG: DEAD/DEAH box helicase [Cytophagales bacterium]|nr:DEAD/DEAH box helicase [Cytophagales bacterium]
MSDIQTTTSFEEVTTIVSAAEPMHSDSLAPEAIPAEPAADAALSFINKTNVFASLGLNADIVRALTDLGFTEPTPVQAKSIPAFLAGRDLLVSSQTGSGKTAAFMLPALHKIASLPVDESLEAVRPAMVEERRGRGRPGKNHRGGDRYADKGGLKTGRGARARGPAQPSVLVLTPTRELAQQVTAATADFGKYLRHIEVTSILGGMPYPKQLEMLARMPDILVATPGRLLDHIGSGRIDLSKLAMMVFDEADRMLDMGFQDDIDQILHSTPAGRQTVMFSATLDERVSALARRMLKDPERISIKATKLDQSAIEQRMHFTDDMGHKHRLLDHILRDVTVKQAIVFTATKRDADQLAEQLADNGFAAGALHGDMNQGARNRTLGLLRSGKMQVLVATDVAARGLDVPDISHVVNFDLPKQSEDYVHRIGRTGRAGRTGVAVSLVNHSEAFNWRRIEQFTNNRVEPSVVEGLEPRRVPSKFSPKPAPGSRGRSYGGASGFNDRSHGGGGYQGRGESRSFGDRGGFADRAPARGGFGERASAGFADRGAPRGRPFGDRADRAPRDDSFANREPRHDPRGIPEAHRFAERAERPSRPNFDAPRRNFGDGNFAAPAAPRKDFSAAPRHDTPRKDFGAPRPAHTGARPTLGADRAPRPSVAPTGRGWR